MVSKRIKSKSSKLGKETKKIMLILMPDITYLKDPINKKRASSGWRRLPIVENIISDDYSISYKYMSFMLYE